MRISEVWNKASKKDRKKLLKELGYKAEWADISFEDLPSRSGGMLRRDLIKLWRIREKKYF